MTSFKQGEVVLVPFPFTSGDTSKKRPAVIISNNSYNLNRTERILIPITSTRHNTLLADEIEILGNEVRIAGLLSESVARAGLLFTVEDKQIIRKLGSMPNKLFQRVLTAAIANLKPGDTAIINRV